MRGFAWLAGSAAVCLVTGLAAMPAAMAGAAPASTSGSTLYVDPHGACNDKGPGTQAEPFCTIQVAANLANPGQTVEITTANADYITQTLTITRSGAPGEPIMFAWPGTGSQPVLAPEKQTGHAVVTLEDVHDVSITGLEVLSYGSDDGIDVTGASRISLNRLSVENTLISGSPRAAADISIATSSGVTISRTRISTAGETAAANGVLATNSTQLTVTTNAVQMVRGSGITLDGTTNAAVTSNTVLAECAGGVQGNAVALSGRSSGTVENNVLLSVSGAASSACAPPAAALAVDARSASGVTADYNALFSRGGASSPYNWAGTSYPTVAAFQAAVPGQGAHDSTLPNGFTAVPPEGSPAIDSANCAAPGELSTDLIGEPRVRDPLATQASLGNGACYADRGAFERQDSLPITQTVTPAADALGYEAAAVPATFGVTITSAATSPWNEPVSYTVTFGDGSAPVQATPGTAVTHTYLTPGQYTVGISAADTSGSTARISYPVFAVTARPLVPTLSAAPAGLRHGNGIEPDVADFSYSPGGPRWELATATMDIGTPAGSYGGELWPTPPGVDFEYVYPAPGTYRATLTLTDVLGRVSTARTTITVGDEPQDIYPLPVYNSVGAKPAYNHAVGAHAVVKIPLSKLITPGYTARAAFVNVLVTGPEKAGSLVVYPNGTPRPALAAVRFQAGRAAENSVLASGSTVDFYNGSPGRINLAVFAYGMDDSTSLQGIGELGETYAPVSPARVLPRTRLRGGGNVAFRVAGLDHVPAQATDVILDITAAGGSAAGHFVTWDGSQPLQSQIPGAYWAKGQQVTGLAMAPVSGGRAVLANASSGAAYFTADLVGYYTAPTRGAVFLPVTPRRLLTVTIAGRHAVRLAVSGRYGIPATTATGAGTTAVAVNLTASGATGYGTITAYGDGTARPGTTALSYAPGTPGAAAAIIGVGRDGAIDLFNAGAKPVIVTVDLSGSYYAYP